MKTILTPPNNTHDFKLKYYAFDYDDNILHMPTVIHMDKLVDGKWVPVDLSTSEFAKHRMDENYRIRNGNLNDAFCEFRDFGPRGQKAFLMDTQSAIKSGSFAPSWGSFLKCLSEGSIFSIITARGHEPDSIREAIEYIIDNILSKIPSKNPGRTLADEMYQNLGKFMYIFKEVNGHIGELKLRGTPSKDPIVQKYLNLCDFYGVTSKYFNNEFGGGDMTFGSSNPERAKEIALNAFIEKCNGFGRKLNDYFRRNGIDKRVKKVSIGFSDDDRRNVEHVKKVFHEKPLFFDEHEVKLNVYDTSNRDIKGGEQTKFRKIKESNQSIIDQVPYSSPRRTPAGLFQNDIVKFTEFYKSELSKITKPIKKKLYRKRKKF